MPDNITIILYCTVVSMSLRQTEILGLRWQDILYTRAVHSPSGNHSKTSNVVPGENLSVLFLHQEYLQASGSTKFGGCLANTSCQRMNGNDTEMIMETEKPESCMSASPT